jgi:uncharacterized protein YndB with AHSA1/START domain
MMVSNSVEREVLIHAPVEVVWSIVTEPQHLGRWLSDSAEIDLRPGGELVLGFGQVGTASGTVERVERPHLFSFRWVTPEPDRDPGAHERNSTLVEFLLRADADGTLLRVVESGFASVDGTDRQSADLAARHASGWGRFLDQLAGYVSTVDVPA